MWSHENIQTVILDLYGKVSRTSFTGDAGKYKLTTAHWKDDLGLDSIELMELAAEVNSFFQLFTAPGAPYLLSFERMEEWVEQIFAVKQRHNEGVCFHTSGTSGQSKAICHPFSFLEREIDFLVKHFQHISRIIPLVPSYSIYGFLFTVMLPEKLHAKLQYPSETDWKDISKESLIVATPFHWQLLLDTLPSTQLKCKGVSAAAVLYNHLFQSILHKGIQLTEIYGATETAGVAMRQHWQDPFMLFPYWQLLRPGEESALLDRDHQQVYHLMDRVKQVDEHTFFVEGRKDNQVNIAGVLVNTAHITAVIQQMPNVLQCEVSAKAMDDATVIQAVIRLQSDTNEEREKIEQLIKARLSAPEIPRQIYFSKL